MLSETHEVKMCAGLSPAWRAGSTTAGAILFTPSIATELEGEAACSALTSWHRR